MTDREALELAIKAAGYQPRSTAVQGPSDTLLKLCNIGHIHGLDIRQRQTGTDTADTFVKITGSSGELEGRWSTYEAYLDLRPGHDYVCSVKPGYVKIVQEWHQFCKDNAAELAEYERLRKKFERAKAGKGEQDD